MVLVECDSFRNKALVGIGEIEDFRSEKNPNVRRSTWIFRDDAKSL